MADVYVMAVLGGSVGTLTELLWHLIAREGHTVTGVEVWTTKGAGRTGENALLHHGPTLWANLCDALGTRAASLPAYPDPLSAGVPPDGLIEGMGVFSLGVADVVDQEAAAQVDSRLFLRVRAVVERLAPAVQLVGSLAGGRKTMSTALYQAFSLSARGTDRLVHVLLHGSVEAVLRDEGRLERFACPTDEAVAQKKPHQQVFVHEVPFPPIAELVGESQREAIQRGDLRDAWRAVREGGPVIGEVDLVSHRVRLRRGSWTSPAIKVPVRDLEELLETPGKPVDLARRSNNSQDDVDLHRAVEGRIKYLMKLIEPLCAIGPEHVRPLFPTPVADVPGVSQWRIDPNRWSKVSLD